MRIWPKTIPVFRDDYCGVLVVLLYCLMSRNKTLLAAFNQTILLR